MAQHILDVTIARMKAFEGLSPEISCKIEKVMQSYKEYVDLALYNTISKAKKILELELEDTAEIIADVATLELKICLNRENI